MEITLKPGENPFLSTAKKLSIIAIEEAAEAKRKLKERITFPAAAKKRISDLEAEVKTLKEQINSK